MVSPTPSPPTMSMSPESRFACSAAVFSMARMTIRFRAGGWPDQCGFGSMTICAPELYCVIRYGPSYSPAVVGARL